MSIKYECCYCKSIFPAEDSIDGYNQGYRIGFLCPKCGKNIQAGLLAKQKLSTAHYKALAIMFVTFLPALFSRFSEKTISISGMDIELHTMFLVVWLAVVIVLFLSKPSLFRATTFLTDPANRE